MDLSGFTLDTSNVDVIAGVMLTALAGIWVAHRVLAFIRGR